MVAGCTVGVDGMISIEKEDGELIERILSDWMEDTIYIYIYINNCIISIYIYILYILLTLADNALL